MHKARTRFLVTAFAALLLLMVLVPACTLPAAGNTPGLDRSANFTQAAQTLDAQLTLAANGAFPTVTPLSTQAGTSIPVIGPTTAGGSGQGPTPEPGAACDLGSFVADVSIPDGTSFEPGESFVKTWRLQNSGSCTWTPDYAVVFDSGDAMNGPASFPLTQSSVPPGAEVEISINLTAPDDPGSYRGDWLLRNPAGETFGLGSQGTATFWVDITVGISPEADFTFDSVHDCDGNPTAIFRVSNTSEGPLESVQITLVNTATGQTIYGPLNSNGPFMSSRAECPPGGDILVAGSSGFVGGTLAGNPASGVAIEATFTICNQEDLTGACVDDTVEFDVP